MSVYIHNIATLVPQTRYTQKDVLDFMLGAAPWTDRSRRYLKRIYAHSGIETRHSVIRDLAGTADEPFFHRGDDGFLRSPSTGRRNDLFIREAKPMFVELALSALDPKTGMDAGDITHVVTVSCTGFFSPGPEFRIVKELGLPATTGRFHLGFMGCYGLFPALRLADAICRTDPKAAVLVVCLELCSLHIQFKDDFDAILAGAIFADGGGSALVSARPPHAGRSALAIKTLTTTILPDSERDMAWTVGDQGFDIVLSTYVPDIIHANVGRITDELLALSNRSRNDIQRWAIHPGGKAILDKIEKGLELDSDALETSRNVLRDYGNMSSSTLLFVLEKMLRSSNGNDSQTVCAMAFGPGLTVESGILDLQLHS